MAPTTPEPEPLDPGWIAAIESEILDGLPNEQARRLECIRSMKYYRLEGADLIEARNGENSVDFQNRPKRSIPITRRVIRVLASKLYAPGPAREIDGRPEATKWLQGVYSQCHANGRLQQADRMAHLNGMCAVQVGATGRPDRPLGFQFWAGWHEVVPFELPGQANRIGAVVTIDACDQRTTYTFWTREFFRTYRTEKLRPGQTAGGRVARFVPEESGPNPYGCLPFAFFWYETPECGIDEAKGLGPFLANLNATIDAEASDMAQAVKAFHQPQAYAINVDEESLQLTKPGAFMFVEGAVNSTLERQLEPKIGYLQAELDIEGGWANIQAIIDAELEALGVPLTAYRMDQRTLPSGEALIQEQAPLIEYATERREAFRRCEADLAIACLTVAGTYYGRADLLAAAVDLTLSLAWPAPQINLPGAARDEQDKTSLELGLESRVMIAMRRFGMNRTQAVAHLKQAALDEAELAKAGVDPPMLSAGGAARDGDGDGRVGEAESDAQPEPDDDEPDDY